jgi:hypothetical protein
MRTRLLLGSALGIAVVGGVAWASIPTPEAARPYTAHPTVVELYQSQGCSSCPPAQDNINAIADRGDVVALSFSVTYWDYLGWKDSFGSPRYTARQWDYAHHNDRDQVGTPQVWVNGRTTILGSDKAELNAAIARAGAFQTPPLSIRGGRLAVAAGAAPKGGADVWLVRYDPRTVQVAIRAGENGGRTLPHRDIVRDLVKIGRWTGAAQSFALPGGAPAPLKSVVLLQGGSGGPILDALRI